MSTQFKSWWMSWCVWWEREPHHASKGQSTFTALPCACITHVQADAGDKLVIVE
jgi:hypothetical protein